MFLPTATINNKAKRQPLISYRLLLIVSLIGLLIFGKGVYMQGKAILAQQLLTFAWARHLQDGEMHKAWPWADSAPFAQLRIDGQEPLIILSGATGSNLAFAPSWMVSSAPFAQGGNSVLVGHNDTHFNPLKNIQPDEQLVITTYEHSVLFYQVVQTKVVNELDLSVLQSSGEELLTLITCYPFDSTVYNSDLRLAVISKRIKDAWSPINIAMVNKRLNSQHR
jgi:sortase A